MSTDRKWVESRGGTRNDIIDLQFSSSFGLLGGPGRLMMTRDESCDLVTISSLSLTLVFMRRTLSSCLHIHGQTKDHCEI